MQHLGRTAPPVFATAMTAFLMKNDVLRDLMRPSNDDRQHEI
jgi:hypothetical protein